MALRWIEGFELYGTGTGAATQTGLETGLVAEWDAAWFTVSSCNIITCSFGGVPCSGTYGVIPVPVKFVSA